MKYRLLALVLVLLAGATAFGQTYVEEPTDRDVPCFWEDDICFEYEQTGGGAHPAPRMLTCTSNYGCKKCFMNDDTGEIGCATDFRNNGACTCQRDATQPSGCKLEGSCTYKQ